MRIPLCRFGLLLLIYTVCCVDLPAEQTTKLLRFPDVYRDQVVFCYGGDLWRAPVDGGSATRVTAHPGIEVFPKFSPDGTRIAFTGQYDGDEQVYVVESNGGVPRQLTYYPANGPLPDRWGFDNQVYGWNVDGSAVLFRSMRHGWSLTDTRLYTVRLEGGLPVPLPMAVSGAGDFSPDGKQVAFCPLTRDFRTWKRYEGGWAQDIFVFNLEDNSYQQITDSKRSDRDPMWIGNRIYFSSDRTGTLNLFYYDTKTKKTEQVTKSDTYDLRWPSKGESQIVYELNGELEVLDTATGNRRKIDIFVPNDGLAERPKRVSADDYMESFGLSPKGERVVIVGRGDVFSVPAEKGVVRNLTRSSDSHEKAASWSPDGKRIVFISDRSGEEQLYLIDQKGAEDPDRLTSNQRVMLYRPLWSPAGDRIAFSDKEGRLLVVDVESKEITEVADDARGTISDYMWSPHGGYLAFSMSDDNDRSSIFIWQADGGKLERVTDEMFNESEPVWDPDGKYLYFLSDREFAPQIGSVEWNYVANRQTVILALTLQADGEHPYPPENDEVELDDDKKSDKDKADQDKEDDEGEKPDDEQKADKNGTDADQEKAAAKDVDNQDKQGDDGAEEDDQQPIKIDFDGLGDRVTRVPVPADNYYGLEAVKGKLLYVRGGPFFYGRSSGVEPRIMMFDHEKREAETLVEDAGGFATSFDGKKLLVASNGGLKSMTLRAASRSRSHCPR